MNNNNLDYCSKEVQTEINNVLNNSTVSFMTKSIIRDGLKKDCLDAANYVQLAADVLKQVRDNILNK